MLSALSFLFPHILHESDYNQYLLQDKNESYFLLNNLLSLNTELENDTISYEGSGHRRDGREIFNMDWLDSLEFKEEHAEAEESGYPEKDSERKRKHNQGERGRERECAQTSWGKFLPCWELGWELVKMDYWH